MPSSGWVQYTKGVKYMHLADGENMVFYEVLISDKQLHGMIANAARSKAGRSVRGPVVVKIKKRLKA